MPTHARTTRPKRLDPKTAERCSRGLVLALAVLVAGCSSTPPTRFMHRWHRETYAITGNDLGKLQFFVSSRVIAHDVDAPGPEGVVLVAAQTPGVAVDSGPRWIRVRFQEGGPGVVFLADPEAARNDTEYTIATEVDGAPGYRLVRDAPNRVLRVGERRYRIIEGTGAHLLVDGETLKKVLAGRRQVEGQRVPGE